MRRVLIVGIAAAIAVMFFGGVQAMPRSSQLDQLKTTIDANMSLVQKVHGCHRVCRRGPRGVWHRHVGPRCTWVRC